MRTITGISWLRAFAAALVLLSHVSYWCGGSSYDVLGALLARGDLGVAIFFALSAFLLVRPGTQEPCSVYARKRFARILPAYWLVLAAVVMVAFVLHETLTWRMAALHVAVFPGFTTQRFQGFSQAWSLTTECCFYVAVPFLRKWFSRCQHDGRSPLLTLGALSVVSLVAQSLSASSGSPAWSIFSTSALGHVSWFAGGLALRWLYDGDRLRLLRAPTSVVLAWVAAGYILAATPLGGPSDLSTPTIIAAGAKEVLYGALASAALLLALTTRPSASATVNQLGTWCGDVSYGVFLWHVLVLQVLFQTLHLTPFHTPIALVLIATASIAVMLAQLTWTSVERPMIRWGHRGRPAESDHRRREAAP